MKKALLVTAALLIAGPAFAQSLMSNPTAPEASAPRAPRARGIATDLAIEASQAAIAACAAAGPFKTTAAVIDSEGVPVVIIAGDGAAAITSRIAMGKAAIALKTKMTTGDVLAKSKTDTALAASIADLGTVRPGGIPIMVGADTVGALAISGTPSGATDETCAKTGLAKVQDRLK